MDNYNKIRQAKCQETYDEIIDYLKKHKEEKNNPAIILKNPSWHIGIIGIVASKIVEEFNKPCFLMTEDENRELAEKYDLKNLNVDKKWAYDMVDEYGNIMVAIDRSKYIGDNRYLYLENETTFKSEECGWHPYE